MKANGGNSYSDDENLNSLTSASDISCYRYYFIILFARAAIIWKLYFFLSLLFVQYEGAPARKKDSRNRRHRSLWNGDNDGSPLGHHFRYHQDRNSQGQICAPLFLLGLARSRVKCHDYKLVRHTPTPTYMQTVLIPYLPVFISGSLCANVEEYL